VEHGPGGARIGDAYRAVALEDGLEGGDARAHSLGPAAEAREEMRLDESRDDAHVRVHPRSLEQHGNAVDVADTDVIAARGHVVADLVPAGDGGPDQLGELGRGSGTVCAGAAYEDDLVGPAAAPLELGQQRWEDRCV